jgi:hypothetical protein
MAAKKTTRAETPVPADHMTEALQAQPATPQLSVTTPEKFQQILESLKQQTKIIDDSGSVTIFQGEEKEDFIKYCEQAYPIIERMVKSVHEIGEFLDQVRQSLKPKGLFLTWLDFTGFPRRTAYSYLKLHDTFQAELPAFSYLGVKKLLAASTLKDGMEFVKERETDLSRMPVTEVEKWVKDIKQKAKKGKGGRKPKFEEIGRFKLRTSTDGTKVIVENLDDDTRKKLLAAINEVLSQVK